MDLGNKIKTQFAITPQTVSAGSTTGSELDRLGYEGSVFSCFIGTIYGSPTATTVTFAAYECATSGGSYDAIDGATAVVTSTNGLAEINLDLVDYNRYIEIYATTAFTGGSSPYCLIGAEAIFGGAKEYPI